MRCEEIEPLIELFLDGEISEQTADAVTQHLATCAECTRHKVSLHIERHFYAGHEPELEVPTNFWNSVFKTVASLNDMPHQPRTPSCADAVAGIWRSTRAMSLGPAPALVLLLLTVGLTVGITLYISSGRGGDESSLARQQDEVVTRTPATSSPELSPSPAAVSSDSQPTAPGARDAKQRKPRKRETADELVRDAEQKYLAAIAMLSQDAKRHVARLDPEARTRFDQTLGVIDRAIAGTRNAVHASPGDPVAVQYMLAAYSRKVDLLRQAVGD